MFVSEFFFIFSLLIDSRLYKFGDSLFFKITFLNACVCVYEQIGVFSLNVFNSEVI